jgi:hypothetical protein
MYEKKDAVEEKRQICIKKLENSSNLACFTSKQPLSVLHRVLGFNAGKPADQTEMSLIHALSAHTYSIAYNNLLPNQNVVRLLLTQLLGAFLVIRIQRRVEEVAHVIDDRARLTFGVQS